MAKCACVVKVFDSGSKSYWGFESHLLLHTCIFYLSSPGELDQHLAKRVWP